MQPLTRRRVAPPRQWLTARSLLPDGRVCYELQRRWKDGTTHLVLESQLLLERLVALALRSRGTW